LLNYKDLAIVRKILSDSYYYDLEKYNYENLRTVDFNLKLHFKFYRLEQFWLKKIKSLKKWEFKKLLDIILTSIIKYFYNISYKKAQRIKKVFIEDNNFSCHNFFLKNFNKSKLIIIERDMGGITSSLISRKKTKNIYHTHNFDKINSFSYLINKKLFCFKNEENKNISKKLIKLYKKRIYICNFQKLIMNTEHEMKKISKFLKIKFDKTLLTPTHSGKKIQTTTKKEFVGEEIYKKEEILNNNQIKILKIIDKKWNLNDLNPVTVYTFFFLFIKYNFLQILKKIFFFFKAQHQ
jgi:hypothetical protein